MSRRFIALGAALALMLLHVGSVFAVEHREVRSEGSGPTLKEAMSSAFADAIGQVNGVAVDSRQELDRVEVSSGNTNNSEFYSSQAFRNSVRSATKGVIAEYVPLSQQKDAAGAWHVALSCKVLVYKRDAIADRKRIALIPLRLSSKEFMVDGAPVDREGVNRIFGQSLLSSLVQSRRFTVLDREYIAETLGERQLIADGNTPVEQMVRLGQDLAADYIIVGTLEDLNLSTSTVTMQLSGHTLSSRNGRVEVSYRVIDIDTKQVVYSDFARIQLGEEEIRKADPSIGAGGLESALGRVAADRIGRQILNAIYPVLVVSAGQTEVTLGQGGSGVQVGDRFEVYEYGEVLVDSYTKESIGRKESLVATVEVVRVNPKQSIARIVKTEKDLAAAFQPKRFVCREVVVDHKAALQQKMKKDAEERKKAFDKDW